MGIAGRVYLKGKNKSEVDNKEKAVKLVRRRNKIFTGISNAQTYKDLMNINRDINNLIEEGYDSEADVTVLRSKLYDRLVKLRESCSERCEQLKEKENTIKAEVYPESADVLSQLHVRADNIMLRLLSQFSKDPVNNKMLITKALKTKDRATGIALLKLASNPLMSQYFTPKAKQEALEMSRSDGEKAWSVDHDKRIKNVGRERGSVVMENFFLSQAENVIKPKNGTYFEN